MQDRLHLVFASLIGQTVRVQDSDNQWYEGLFHECSKNTKAGMEIVLQAAYNISKNEKGMVKPIEKLTINCENFVQMFAKDVELCKEKKTGNARGFATDTEISSGSSVASKELEKFQFDEKNEFATIQLDSNSQDWDQFEQNRQKFGVTSNYHEDLYTTKLDKSKLTLEQQRAAERIAAEIEGDQQTQRKIFGRVRNADEAEAAGDDEGDEWASDVRNVDGTVRGSYHKAQAAPPANPNVYKPPRGNAWGQSNTLADKLKNEKKIADLKANDPAILSTTLMPSSATIMSEPKSDQKPQESKGDGKPKDGEPQNAPTDKDKEHYSTQQNKLQQVKMERQEQMPGAKPANRALKPPGSQGAAEPGKPNDDEGQLKALNPESSENKDGKVAGSTIPVKEQGDSTAEAPKKKLLNVDAKEFVPSFSAPQDMSGSFGPAGGFVPSPQQGGMQHGMVDDAGGPPFFVLGNPQYMRMAPMPMQHMGHVPMHMNPQQQNMNMGREGMQPGGRGVHVPRNNMPNDYGGQDPG
ncbi:hypothetical protein GUITHDRAFT_121685 [Guillardia theta CCMP2712]|uniref:LsmAD domain-containing protein n=1 Tax=Guillardia theta (strain CCMP2712) TaxID=905079 RepID=L1I7C3_GUITC|nr:hypothetical protein GUITHDRAFT_121685 [Guillardia theta CCMP2712]EKX32153.1 hypothetical protein GUITHDRAFT_121685 [Guillardia theta CCMP2712]|eukprot:XP_005819133.1 hypothetical protein GUITHDRAFT_121685 [Guillardia theta CCMP2712]